MDKRYYIAFYLGSLVDVHLQVDKVYRNISPSSYTYCRRTLVDAIANRQFSKTLNHGLARSHPTNGQNFYEYLPLSETASKSVCSILKLSFNKGSL